MISKKSASAINRSTAKIEILPSRKLTKELKDNGIGHLTPPILSSLVFFLKQYYRQINHFAFEVLDV